MTHRKTLPPKMLPACPGASVVVSEVNGQRYHWIKRVAWEPENGANAFDEIVATNVAIHIERLNDGHYWMSITPSDADDHRERQIVKFMTRRGALIVGRTEPD